jgi:hypothetical protein
MRESDIVCGCSENPKRQYRLCLVSLSGQGGIRERNSILLIMSKKPTFRRKEKWNNREERQAGVGDLEELRVTY